MIAAQTPVITGSRAAAPLRGAERALRLVVLGGVSLLLATAAHTAGGGALPGPGLLAVLAALLGLAALLITQRRCGFLLLVAVLTLEQAALHAVFTAAANAATACTTMPGSLAHHGVLGQAGGCAPLPGVGGDSAMVMSGAGMWLAHTAAVLATAWLLSRGEAWLWRTADRIIRAATAAPSSPGRSHLAVANGTARSASYVSTASSPAAPRGPPVTTRV